MRTMLLATMATALRGWRSQRADDVRDAWDRSGRELRDEKRRDPPKQ